MSYKTDTNKNADFAESLVATDIMKRGWIVLTPSSRDSEYDFVVDLGAGKFEKIQVKKLSGKRNNCLVRRLERGNQTVTENGKVRNSIDYAERGIDWLAGVNIHTSAIYYYQLGTYSKIKAKRFSIDKYQSDEFPINKQIKRNTEY